MALAKLAEQAERWDGALCFRTLLVYRPSCFRILVWVTRSLNEGEKTSSSSSNQSSRTRTHA
jgi:hypothetical protein